MKVKICGIQTIEDAQSAEASGADFIGLVFAPSKRRVTTTKAAEIAGSLTGDTKKVGVFVNETIENIIHIAKAVQLDYIQLHGSEPVETAQELPYPVIKSFSIDKADSESIHNYPCEYLLIDSPGTTHEGGSGITFDWSKLGAVDIDRNKFILAGGLSPDNISKAIQITDPIGVDVSSGVETEGIKDKKKIKQFIQHAKTKRKVEKE